MGKEWRSPHWASRHNTNNGKGIIRVAMNPAALPWWGWLVVAVACWLLQLVASAYTYKDHPSRNTTPAWIVRVALIAGMVVSGGIALIRFVKWGWRG